jgi:hypothetical protein
MGDQTDIYERLTKVELELVALKRVVSKNINDNNSLHRDIYEIATGTNIAQYGCSIAIRTLLARLAKEYENDRVIYQFIQTLYESL